MSKDKKAGPCLPELGKGTILIVKAPPYFEREYLYEVLSAGASQVRATLYKSPTVKKSWPVTELALLFEMKIVRLAEAKDLERLSVIDPQ